MFTEVQVATHKVRLPGSETGIGTVKSCAWRGDDGKSLLVSFNSAGGITVQYQAQEQYTKYDLWEPTQVEGYPAVFAAITDRRDKGECGLIVGVNDDVAFNVYLQGGDGKQSCDEVGSVARQILTILKD